MTPIGVTVITPSYRKVGREAVRRFKKFTGLDVIVLRGTDKTGFDLKLQLDKLCPKRIVVFFDADLWFLSQTGFANINQLGCVLAVHDSAALNPHAFPHTDCQDFGMPKTEYFNSGLMVWDNANPSHRQIFVNARKLKSKVVRNKHKKPTDVTDQFYLNMGRIQSEVPLSFLPTNHNFYLFSAFWGQISFIPRTIIGLHGAGIKTEHKFERLTEQAKVFTHEHCPMHAEAAAFEVARNMDLR